jgi:hypothetical protein
MDPVWISYGRMRPRAYHEGMRRDGLVGSLVAATVIVAACSRGGSRDLRSRTAEDGSAASSPRTGTTASLAPPSSSDSGSAPSAAPGTGDGGQAGEVALKNAPPLTLRPVGPALIEVIVGDRGPASWTTIEVERRALSAGARQHDKFERNPKGGLGSRPPRRHLHSAKPGTSYAYRARSGGEWSPEVTVRTPDPSGPPPTPGPLTAQAQSPFAVRLAWDADARAAAGFEIEVERKGHYVRAALVDPTEREYVHNHRLPGRPYAYRVRAFNARGASAPSTVATITTPDRGDLSSAAKAPAPPCIRLPPATDPAKVQGIPRDVLNAGGGLPLYNDPEGTNGLRRHLIGHYDGCFRDFGAFNLQADITEVPGFTDEGFPLLRAIAGAGQYVGAQILTLRFSRGRYTVVNGANFCGDPWPDRDPDDPGLGAEGSGQDLTSYSPPFESCQRDLE